MVDAARDTKRRIMTTSGRLFQRVRYTGTGLKRIAAEAEAAFAIYHFFPGGQQQLASEVVHAERRMYRYRDLVVEVLSQADDPTRAMDVAFTAAAVRLVETDFADACPIAKAGMLAAMAAESQPASASTSAPRSAPTDARGEL
jgi:AcrR family transcriptional regulator